MPESARPAIRLPSNVSSAYVDILGRQHKLTVMEETLELAEGAASNDPEVGLRAVAALRY
jgi:hypothetical protein